MPAALSYHHQQALYWSLVAGAALVSVLCFLAAYLHRIGRQSLAPISVKRRLNGPSPILCNGQYHLCDVPAIEAFFLAELHGNANAEKQQLPNHNQYEQLQETLKSGSRVVNMDVGFCEGEVKLIPHKSCDLGALDLEEVLTNIADFLGNNPHEVVMVRSQLKNHEYFQQDSGLARFDNTIQTVPGWTDEKIYRYPGTGSWPTLRELIEADTRVVFIPYIEEPLASFCDSVPCTVDHTNLMN